jgi:exopolyphosphatase/guanosine-5'-triphosphate,3'-diphosphate pyrophosphatase
MADNAVEENSLNGRMLAAVDLGSNSFHMIVSRSDENGSFTLIDKEKEMVRLRGGLDENGILDDDVEARAYECLKRFGDRLRSIPPENVRIAGTNTLRRMRDSDEFVRRGSELLGHPIDIISGREEARLVYLGVSHTLSNDRGKQLVIDIGGGSTEFIIGQDFVPQDLESLDVGAASSTQRFFRNGDVRAKNWAKASTEIRLEILPIQKTYMKGRWSRATGSSGTITSTLNIILALGLEPFGITLTALYAIRDKMIEAKNISEVSLPGLGDDRLPVYAGGLAVLIAVFEALKIDHMTVSEGALREGLLYDMLGRIQHEDVRDRSIEEISTRFQVDTEQAERVRSTALYMFDQVAESWSLPPPAREMLSWGAKLHEIGLIITHSKHHLQGAYILKYAFMQGFSLREQVWLATLVKSHRRKIDLGRFSDFPKQDREMIIRLSILLRLSVLLHRRRDSNKIRPFLTAKGRKIQLTTKRGLDDRELLEADLRREHNWLQRLAYQLDYE